MFTRWFLLFLLLIGFFLSFSAQKVYACVRTGDFTKQGSCVAATCAPTSGVYEQYVTYIQSDGGSCTQLEYFTNNTCNTLASNPCPATCNSDSQCGTGYCAGGVDNFCTTGTRGTWCVGTVCGYDKNCSFSSGDYCTKRQPGSGVGASLGACIADAQATCIPTVNLKANNSDGPVEVDGGDSISLSWAVENVNSSTSCLSNWDGNKSPTGGPQSWGPVNSSNRYDLVCTNYIYDQSKTRGDSVQVNVDCARPCGATQISQCGPGAPTVSLTDSCGDPYSCVCPTPTNTATPTPTVPGQVGDLGCSLTANAVSSDDQGACPSNKWCVRLYPGYSGDPIGWAVNQDWNFGDDTTGFNNSSFETYHRFPRDGNTRTVTLTGTETTGARRSCNTNTRVDVPPLGGSNTPTGGGGRPTSPPTVVPTEPPLEGTGVIRFYNANCTTPYNGTDTFKLLTLAQNGDNRSDAGSYENNMYAEGAGHNNLFYNGTSVYSGNYSHNGSAGVRGCDSTDWHPVYDPGYQLNADGTVSPCGGGRGSGYRWMCEQDGNWRTADSCEDYNNDGSFSGWTECCNGGGSLRRVLNGDTGQCIRQESYPNSGVPQCYPVNNSPITISAGPANRRVSLTSTRGMRRIFSVAGPTGVKLKVIEVCANGDGTCDWQGVQNPSSNPNRGRVKKDFDDGTYPNYYGSGWADSNGSTGSYAYDVCVGVATTDYDVSGRAYLDTNCDGTPESGLSASVSLTGTQTRGPTGTNASGRWSFGQVVAGSGQSHTITVTPTDTVTNWRACSGTNSTDTITYTDPDTTAKTFDVGFAASYGSWFQVTDADVFANGSIVSRIPTTCTVPGCNPYFDLNGTGGYPGVLMHSASTDFGAGGISTKGWKADASYFGTRYDYNTLSALVPGLVTMDTIGSGTANWDGLFTGGLYNGYNWKKRTGDLALSGASASGRAVLFVDGDLRINSDLTLNAASGGFLAVIVRGNIYISPSVTTLHGLYLANGTIFTGAGALNSQLNVRGALIGWGGVTLERDLDPGQITRANNTRPAETVTQAPDLMMNFPKELMRDSLTWREIAP